MWKTVGGLLAFGLVCLGACTTETPDEGTGGGGSTETFGTSACGTCLIENCQAEWTTCYEDPGCALHLDCLLACPVASDGDVDEACADACPVADSSITKDAIGTLTYCRTLGFGADLCPDCSNQQLDDPDLNQTCPSSTETNTCWKCQEEHCCDTDQRCRDNAECLALFECIQDCAGISDTCYADCYALHPDGQVDVGTKFGCVLGLCPAECGSSDPCFNCGMARCTDENMVCKKNPACVLIDECNSNCWGQPDCPQTCFDQYPTGEEDWINHGLCILSLCEAECSGA